MKVEQVEEWICEICYEPIRHGEPTVRIAADSAISDGFGGIESLTDREVLVFGLFHAQCVVDTMNDPDQDDVEYIDEARDIIREAPLCHVCRHKVFEPHKVKKSRFVVFDGGLKA